MTGASTGAMASTQRGRARLALGERCSRGRARLGQLRPFISTTAPVPAWPIGPSPEAQVHSTPGPR